MKGIQNTSVLHNIDTWKSDIFANYAGSDRKDGVISPDGTRYMIKFAEDHTRKNNMDTSYVNNVLSEYLSSHIFSIIGYDVHDTFLATRNDELVVACKNFTSDHNHLIEFRTYLHKHYDSGKIGRVPDIRQIKYVLNNDPTLYPYKEQLWTSYCERFVGDAFVGNFDRHMGNFGYLITQDGTVSPSPVYDNGSTLFPGLSEHAMKTEILPHPKEIAKRALLFPKAALTVNGQKIRYYDMLASNYDPDMTKAVKKIVPTISKKMQEIYEFIDNQTFLSDTRRIFYKTILTARLNLILQPAEERCLTRDYATGSLTRLNNGKNYTEELFEREWENMQRDQEWTEKIKAYQNKINTISYR